MSPDKFYADFGKTLKRANSYLVMPHVSADGDAVGSALALCYFLNAMGKASRLVMDEKVPDKYAFLDEDGLIEVYSDNAEYEADACIALDTGDIKRLGNRKGLFKGSITWNIDHHKTNNGYAADNHIDIKSASTGEIIYGLFKHFKVPVDKKSAEALFTAISTDTGGLRYSNTTPGSMRICADLLELGIDISDISHRVFDMTPYRKLLLKAVAIENMRLHFGGKLALITMKSEDYAFLMGKDEYFDGIVNIANNTEGVLAGILMRETPEGDIKVNMRSSSDDIDVALFANMNGGGGHVRASGFTESSRDFGEVYTQIISYFGKALENA
jgi:phosphoesterase RecJ-like protein